MLEPAAATKFAPAGRVALFPHDGKSIGPSEPVRRCVIQSMRAWFAEGSPPPGQSAHPGFGFDVVRWPHGDRALDPVQDRPGGNPDQRELERAFIDRRGAAWPAPDNPAGADTTAHTGIRCRGRRGAWHALRRGDDGSEWE